MKANEQNVITAPIIDIEAVQKAANEAATKAVLKEVEDYYTGYNSPFRKQISDYLRNNAPTVNLELPQFSAMVINSMKAKIENLVNSACASQIMKTIEQGLTHLEVDEDGTLKTSKLFEEFCEHIDFGNPYSSDDVSLEIDIMDSASGYSWKEMHIKYYDGNEEKTYDVTLHKVSKRDEQELYQILGMPYKYNDGCSLQNRIKIHTNEGHTVEYPAISGICEDDILLTIARCVMFATPIRIDKTDFYKDNSNDD